MLHALDLRGSVRPALTASRAEDFFCPHCRQRVQVRAGARLAAHFAHLPGADTCLNTPAAGHRRSGPDRRGNDALGQMKLFPDVGARNG
jgi:hypothetical protein